jgi:hypothetical protein
MASVQSILALPSFEETFGCVPLVPTTELSYINHLYNENLVLRSKLANLESLHRMNVKLLKPRDSLAPSKTQEPHSELKIPVPFKKRKFFDCSDKFK